MQQKKTTIWDNTKYQDNQSKSFSLVPKSPAAMGKLQVLQLVVCPLFWFGTLFNNFFFR